MCWHHFSTEIICVHQQRHQNNERKSSDETKLIGALKSVTDAAEMKRGSWSVKIVAMVQIQPATCALSSLKDPNKMLKTVISQSYSDSYDIPPHSSQRKVTFRYKTAEEIQATIAHTRMAPSGSDTWLSRNLFQTGGDGGPHKAVQPQLSEIRLVKYLSSDIVQ